MARGMSLVHCVHWFAGMLLAGALLAAVAPTPAFADALADEVADLEEDLVRDLIGLTTWAKGRRISGYRHVIFEMVLRVDPDHRTARKGLRYRRERKGAPWRQAEDYKRPADWNKAQLAKAKTRLEGILVAHRDALLALLDHRDVSMEREEELLGELVRLMPQDAVVRERRGDVQFEGRWMMTDSQLGIERRRALRALAGRLAKERRAAIEPEEEALAQGWPVAMQAAGRAVVGTVSRRVVRDSLLLMLVADGISDEIVGPSEARRGPETTYILADRDEARRMIRRIPAWRDNLEDVEDVSGLWVPGARLAYWKNVETSRLSCAKSVANAALYDLCPKHERGWIVGGVVQRMVWYASGGHGPNSVSLDQTDRERMQDREVSLPKNPDAWPAAAAEVLKREGSRGLASVLTRRLNGMRNRDVLMAYALAAYLMEARPEAFRAFVQASATRHDVDVYVEETLGAPDLEVLTQTLVRWLDEYVVG